ncbi:MAG: LacI family transcriptional regulator [Chloroflexi bacterium]|nr:MAG: LacI family transcriptional regulator [Chloroflexota bacterium]
MTTVTIRDVARRAGVGIATVSRVLNNSPSVRESTRRKVLEAIEELNYSPNQAARRLSRGKTMSIGVIVPYFTNPSVVKRLQGIVSVINSSPYDLVLFDIEKVTRRDVFLRNVPRQKMVDGLLIISLTPTDEEAEQFLASGIPVVLIDAFHPRMNRVIVDNVAGGYKATKYLIELGHQKIAYVSDFLADPFNTPVRDRFEGYKKALQEAGLIFRPEYHLQDKHGRLPAYKMGKQLLRMPDPPTAVFAYSDTQAIGIIEAATENGLSVPGDLSVIGFDDIESAEYLHLTTVHQSLFESGVEGSKLLLTQMQNPDAIPTNPIEIKLPTELVIRKTTAPPA